MYRKKPLWKIVESILAALILSSCGARTTPAPATILSTPNIIPGSTPVSQPSPTQMADPEELRARILAGVRAQSEKSWRYQSVTLTVDGNSGNTVVEYVPPDRYHILGDATTELIVIGQQAYVKQEGEWIPIQIPVANLIDPDAYRRLEESITDILCTGADTLDGNPMQVCQYQSKTKIGETEPVIQTKLWIGSADGLPYKMIVNGQVVSLDADKGEVAGVEATTTITYEYTPTIQIDLPQSFEQWLTETNPQSSNPEMFDAANRDSLVSQLASSMKLAGIQLSAEEISQGLVIASKNEDGEPFIDVNGKEYAIAYYNIDPDPTKEGETLEGRVALGVSIRTENHWRWEELTLKTFAELTGIQMGALIAKSRVDRNADYRSIFLKNYSLALIDGVFWEDRKNSTISDLDFSYFDTVAKFTRGERIPAEFQHVIRDEWKWYPESARTEQLGAEGAEQLLRTHVRTVMEAYKDTFSIWSVVNEAINGDGKGGFTSNPFYDAMGIDYIRVAFDEARKTAPDAILMYNDFDLETDGTKRAQVHEFLQSLIDSGLVDAVGVQMHYEASRPPDKAEVLAGLQEIGSWGVSIHVTELDVDMTNLSGTPEEKLREQARIYREMMSSFLESGFGASFTTFGFTDLTSLYGTDKSAEALAASPLPFDSDLNPKAAYFGMLQAATEYIFTR